MTAQLMTDQCETFQKIEMVSDAELSGEVCRASSMAITRCVVSRHTTAWTVSVRRSSEWTPVLSNLVPIPLPHFAGGHPQGRRQERRTEAAPTIVGSGGGPRTHWTSSRATAHWAPSCRTNKNEAPQRRAARKARLCLNTCWIHQQAAWRSCGGHGGPSEALDRSSGTKKLVQRHTSHRKRAQAAQAARRGRWVQRGTKSERTGP